MRDNYLITVREGGCWSGVTDTKPLAFCNSSQIVIESRYLIRYQTFNYLIIYAEIEQIKLLLETSCECNR